MTLVQAISMIPKYMQVTGYYYGVHLIIQYNNVP